MVIFSLVIIIILIISILYVNQINTKKNNNKLAIANELELKLSIENDIYYPNSTYINITVKLYNVKNYNVNIIDAFSIGTTLDMDLITPSNISLTYLPNHYSYIKNIISLPPGKFKEYSFNLKDFIFYNLPDETDEYEWSEKGIYSLKLIYASTEPDLNSNIITFESM